MKKMMVTLSLCSLVVLCAPAQEDFIKAAGKGDFAKVEAFLKAGIKVNEVRDNGDYCPMTAGETALIIASTNGDLKIVSLLLKYKADPNVTNEGYSALYYAAQEGHLEVVKALDAAGAKINHFIPDGDNALMAAAQSSKRDIVKYLLSKGADKSLRTPEGKRAADFADDPSIKALLQ